MPPHLQVDPEVTKRVMSAFRRLELDVNKLAKEECVALAHSLAHTYILACEQITNTNADRDYARVIDSFVTPSLTSYFRLPHPCTLTHTQTHTLIHKHTLSHTSTLSHTNTYSYTNTYSHLHKHPFHLHTPLHTH